MIVEETASLKTEDLGKTRFDSLSLHLSHEELKIISDALFAYQGNERDFNTAQHMLGIIQNHKRSTKPLATLQK